MTGAFPRGEQVLDRLGPPGVVPPWVALADVAPTLGAQVGGAFEHVLARPALGLRTRELITVAMLATLGGCEGQLAFHVGGALRAGATAAEVVEVLTQVSVYAGVPRALNAVAAARPVFAELGADPAEPAARAVVADFLAAVGRGDRAAALDLLAPDAACLLPVGGSGSWGYPGGIAALYDRLHAVGSLALDVGDLLAERDTVYLAGSYALRAGAVSGVGDVVAVAQVEAGRITRLRLHGDDIGPAARALLVGGWDADDRAAGDGAGGGGAAGGPADGRVAAGRAAAGPAADGGVAGRDGVAGGGTAAGRAVGGGVAGRDEEVA